MNANESLPLVHEESGPYSDLAGRPNPEGLCIVFSPSLAAILHRAESEKGGRLSRTEVGKILNSAPAVAVTALQVAMLEEDRGYTDVDPSRAYEHWGEMRD